MKFRTHIHITMEMNCHNFVDSLNFYLLQSEGLNFQLSNTLVYDPIFEKLQNCTLHLHVLEFCIYI